MGVKLPSRVRRTHPGFIAVGITLVLLGLWCARTFLHDAYTLLAVFFVWSRHARQFLLSAHRDNFDITFSNYSIHQTSAAPFPDLVPPILHHISLGSGASTHSKWTEVRQSCLDIHPGWEAKLWTDETADVFVAQHYPELYDMWMSYRFPIQKIDALRYMVLYRYGGVILDMDLQCKRALGPLRGFEFVAPAAHPVGFSIGFMMAAQASPFVGDLVANLQRYNRNWLGLPYPAVMFSTGCHYASTIHTLQPDRSKLKILGGTRHNPMLHRLNGPVSTPIFNHLGSSSWHSYDAALIVTVGKMGGWKMPVLGVVFVVAVFVGMKRARRGRLRV